MFKIKIGTEGYKFVNLKIWIESKSLVRQFHGFYQWDEVNYAHICNKNNFFGLKSKKNSWITQIRY